MAATSSSMIGQRAYRADAFSSLATSALLRWSTWIVLPVLVLVFSHVNIIDDAYISFRYAFNLAAGQGLVFNPGERVEGITNPLWTLLMSLPIAVGLPVDRVASVLGVVFGMLAVRDAWGIARRVGVAPWAAFLATLVLAVYPGFWLTMANGLEGGLFAFLLMRTLLATISEPRSWKAGVWGGLLFITRPESVLLLPLCAAYQLVHSDRSLTSLIAVARRRLPPLLGLWIAIIVLVTVARFMYYGAWLPNTITDKALPAAHLAGTLSYNVRNGLMYWAGFALASLPITVGAGCAAILARRQPFIWLGLGAVAAEAAILLENGGDWVANYRLLAHYAPLLAVLFAIALDRTGALIDSGRSRSILHTATRFTLGLGLVGGVAWMLHGNDWRPNPVLEVSPQAPCYAAVAQAMKPVLVAGDRVAPEALGFFSFDNPEVYSHDMLGLTDVYVARHGSLYFSMYGKLDADYTYNQIRPNIIVFHNPMIIAALNDAANGRLDNEYTSYSLPGMNCNEPIAVSLRNDVVQRVMPSLAAFAPQPMQASSSQVRSS